LIDGFHELADDQGNTLNPLNLLLSPDELALQVSLLIFDIFFLQLDVSDAKFVSYGQ